METFLIGDLHFGHENIITFKDKDGNRIRPFDSIEEHDLALMHRWNRIVTEKDKVYVLGDVVMKQRYLGYLSMLKGTKILIAGNHDIFSASEYLKYFKDVRAYHRIDKMMLSHIPLHPDSKARFSKNVHAHLHSNIIDDPWYFSVSAEQINFTPISLETIRQTVD